MCGVGGRSRRGSWAVVCPWRKLTAKTGEWRTLFRRHFTLNPASPLLALPRAPNESGTATTLHLHTPLSSTTPTTPPIVPLQNGHSGAGPNTPPRSKSSPTQPEHSACPHGAARTLGGASMQTGQVEGRETAWMGRRAGGGGGG